MTSFTRTPNQNTGPVRALHFPRSLFWIGVTQTALTGKTRTEEHLCRLLLNSNWKPGGLRNDPNHSQNVVVLIEEAWASWSSPEKLVLLQQKNAPVAEALCDFACVEEAWPSDSGGSQWIWRQRRRQWETWRAAWQRHRWYKDTEARPANGLSPALPDGGAWQQSWSASSDYSESSTSTKCPQSVPLCWTLGSDYGRSSPKAKVCHGITTVIVPCRFSMRTASSQGTDTPAAQPQTASGASSSSPMRPSTSGPTSCPPGTTDTFPLVTMAQNLLKWAVFCR